MYNKEYQREYRLRNKEKLSGYRRKYYLKNRDASIAASRKYYSEHKEEYKKWTYAWRARNPERAKVIASKFYRTRGQLMNSSRWYTDRGLEVPKSKTSEYRRASSRRYRELHKQDPAWCQRKRDRDRKWIRDNPERKKMLRKRSYERCKERLKGEG